MSSVVSLSLLRNECQTERHWFLCSSAALGLGVDWPGAGGAASSVAIGRGRRVRRRPAGAARHDNPSGGLVAALATTANVRGRRGIGGSLPSGFALSKGAG
jgi:hypothetical protein